MDDASRKMHDYLLGQQRKKEEYWMRKYGKQAPGQLPSLGACASTVRAGAAAAPKSPDAWIKAAVGPRAALPPIQNPIKTPSKPTGVPPLFQARGPIKNFFSRGGLDATVRTISSDSVPASQGSAPVASLPHRLPPLQHTSSTPGHGLPTAQLSNPARHSVLTSAGDDVLTLDTSVPTPACRGTALPDEICESVNGQGSMEGSPSSQNTYTGAEAFPRHEPRHSHLAQQPGTHVAALQQAGLETEGASPKAAVNPHKPIRALELELAVLKSVKGREDTIDRLKVASDKLEHNFGGEVPRVLSHTDPLVRLFYRLVHTLRQRTLDAIEHIAAWRRKTQAKTPFIYYGSDYLRNMGADLAFLDRLAFLRGRLGSMRAAEDPFLAELTPDGIPLEEATTLDLRRGNTRFSSDALRIRMARKVLTRCWDSLKKDNVPLTGRDDDTLDASGRSGHPAGLSTLQVQLMRELGPSAPHGRQDSRLNEGAAAAAMAVAAVTPAMQRQQLQPLPALGTSTAVISVPATQWAASADARRLAALAAGAGASIAIADEAMLNVTAADAKPERGGVGLPHLPVLAGNIGSPSSFAEHIAGVPDTSTSGLVRAAGSTSQALPSHTCLQSCTPALPSQLEDVPQGVAKLLQDASSFEQEGSRAFKVHVELALGGFPKVDLAKAYELLGTTTRGAGLPALVASRPSNAEMDSDWIDATIDAMVLSLEAPHDTQIQPFCFTMAGWAALSPLEDEEEEEGHSSQGEEEGKGTEEEGEADDDAVHELQGGNDVSRFSNSMPTGLNAAAVASAVSCYLDDEEEGEGEAEEGPKPKEWLRDSRPQLLQVQRRVSDGGVHGQPGSVELPPQLSAFASEIMGNLFGLAKTPAAIGPSAGSNVQDLIQQHRKSQGTFEAMHGARSQSDAGACLEDNGRWCEDEDQPTASTSAVGKVHEAGASRCHSEGWHGHEGAWAGGHKVAPLSGGADDNSGDGDGRGNEQGGSAGDSYGQRPGQAVGMMEGGGAADASGISDSGDGEHHASGDWDSGGLHGHAGAIEEHRASPVREQDDLEELPLSEHREHREPMQGDEGGGMPLPLGDAEEAEPSHNGASGIMTVGGRLEDEYAGRGSATGGEEVAEGRREDEEVDAPFEDEVGKQLMDTEPEAVAEDGASRDEACDLSGWHGDDDSAA